MKQKQAVGLIGLGNAGMALATPLLRKFDLVGYDLSQSRCKLARDTGLVVVESASEVARRCSLILLSLPSPAASRAAISAIDAERLEGRLIIETSTVSPGDIDWLVEFASQRGAAVVDAAVVGGVHKLEAGRTTFLVGASQANYARAIDVLGAAAEEIFHLGGPGAGMRAKLVNNAVAHTTMVMLLEAAALAVKLGVPLDVFYKLMSRESGLMRPLTHRLGERISKQDFQGGMSTANARKDSALILELARDLGVPLFTMQASHSVFEIANNSELKGLDYAAISTLWEQWIGIKFATAEGTDEVLVKHHAPNV